VTLQYRVVVGKKDERVEGPDGADVVVTVPLEIVTADGFDATVEFMRGRLKTNGPSGELLQALKQGDVQAAVSRLASRP
jgi:hypothetical protein